MRSKYLGAFSSLILILLFSFIGVSAVNAQTGSTAGSIDGNVADQQGAIIAGTKVIAKQSETNLVRETITGEDGSFHFVQMLPGVYEIRAETEGFQPGTAKATVNIGRTTLIEFKLKVAGESNVIEVRANAVNSIDKTESSTIQDLSRIESLPINRRNFLDFSLTSARVTIDRTPTQGVTSSSGMSFNAQSGRRNNVTIDGMDNNDTFGGAVRSTFSQEAVQEFQVVSDNYSAEFGRAVGGVVNIVTRGGTNQYHGNIFFLNRSDELSARDAFAAFEPDFKQYQFGATFGGPIKTDKAFFFGSFERLSLKQNVIVTISDDTVAAARRQGFSGTNNGPTPFGIGITSFLGRADFNLNPNDRLYVRYNFGGTFDGKFEPFGALTDGTSGNVTDFDDNAVALSNTYLSAGLNLVNETRFIYSHRDQSAFERGPGPFVQLFAPEGNVKFGGAPTAPFARIESIYQVVDNVSLSRGRHQIKFGGDFIYRNVDRDGSITSVFRNPLSVFVPLDFSAITGIPGLPFFTGLQAFDPTLRTPEQRGFLMAFAAQAPQIFPGFPTLPLQDLSLPVFFTQGFGDIRVGFTTKQFAAFVQDDVKLRPNLMIKAGLRYDINRIDFAPKNNGNFSPRVALAYSPAHLQRLRMRAAYGIFFAGAFSGLSGPIQLFTNKQYQIPQLLFPFSILAFAQPGHKFPFIDQAGQLPPGLPFIPQLSLTFEFQKNLRNSYSQQASAGIEYLIGDGTIVGVSYNYVRGLKLLAERNINPIVRPAGNPFLSALTGRVDPTRGDVTFYGGDGDSYYNSVTFQLERRFSKHLGLLAHYTFAKAIDNFFDVRIDLTDAPVDPLHIRKERGLSSQDIRNRFVLSGIWDISYSKNPLLTNYKLSAIFSANSGLPYNLLAGVDLNQSGDAPPGDRPLIGNTPIARNAGVLPGFASLDMRLAREVKLGETRKIEGFFEVFNLFNRVNISEIDRTFPPDAQGRFNLPEQDGGRFIAPRERYRNAFAPRQFQLGLKVTF